MHLNGRKNCSPKCKQILLSLLPDEFESKTLVAEAASQGISRATALRWNDEWQTVGLIQKIKYGVYKKIAWYSWDTWYSWAQLSQLYQVSHANFYIVCCPACHAVSDFVFCVGVSKLLAYPHLHPCFSRLCIVHCMICIVRIVSDSLEIP